MSAELDPLLDATVRHMQELKARGERYVNVSPETLTALAQPPPPVGAAPLSAAVMRATPAVVAAAPPVPAMAAATAPKSLSSAPASTTPTDKVQAMAALRLRAQACVKCPHLVKTRRNVVVGVGDPNSPLLFIGEAPGADEDRQGEPFVGAAGQLLTKIIQTMGLSRQTVFIANILKCRPDTPGQSSGNRPPTEEEMETCIPWLLEQIDIIQPKVIVALGATAVKGLLHNPTGITRLRGHWQTFRGIPTMPTYHPAYLLRNQAISEKRKIWEDMLSVMEKLGMNITEKQRGFFLKAGG
ncbi:MAG: uracil-DNA glycosylase [Verrucomicrobia bacterium]|nr:uracil-DNA glycosylase [Verrucomicrobiota bacterium]